MKRIVFIFLFIFLVFNGFSNEKTEKVITHIHSTDIFKTTEILSGEQFEGRLTGSKGFQKACDYAANIFEKAGVKAGYKHYLQPFSVEYTKVYDSSLKITHNLKEDKVENTKYEYFTDFYPMGFSGSRTVSGNIVFVGYGITAPEYKYDDYRDVDIKGKIALIIKGVPSKTDYDWKTYNSHTYRTQNAYEHGATAVLYITKPVSNPNGKHIENFPILQISEKIADQIITPFNTDVKSLKTMLNLGKNISFDTKANAEIMVKSQLFKDNGYNVVGMIPGSNKELSSECVVIGAHLDHTGAWPVFCPGAEDNGSGASTLLNLVEAFAKADITLERTIVFVLFGGEEMGLLGSKHFVSNLPKGIKNVKFAINMDMVGAGTSMYILGLKKDKWFEETVLKVKKDLNIKPIIKGNNQIGSEGSDHGPFISKGFKAVSVFSSGGDHHGYHTPEDTIYWITPRILEDIGKIVAGTAIEIANME